MTEKVMFEIILELVGEVLSAGSEKRRRGDYQMEERDFTKIPNIPDMDWADCSWADPEDSLYPDSD